MRQSKGQLKKDENSVIINNKNDKGIIMKMLLRSLFVLTCLIHLAAFAQPDPGPGPGGGGGPGDPPRATPGLAPAILAGVATTGYLGYQMFKSRRK